jgi:hypothetical protein
MSIQAIIVIGLIMAAVAFVGRSLLNKRRSFSTKGGCSADCGCGERK